jgi:Cystatin domain
MKKIFQTRIILALVLVGLATSGVAAQGQRRILGGSSKVSPTSADVVEAAEFAIGEARKKEEQTKVKLVSVQTAERQSVAGTIYKLCMKVNIDDEEQDIKVVVFRALPQNGEAPVWELQSWDHESCSEDK